MERIYNTLYPFQKDLVDKCKIKDRYGIFFEMGLGKTRTSLAIMQEKKAKKILILCQLSKIWDWEEECRKWYGEDKTIIVLSTSSNKKKYKQIAQSEGDFIVIAKFTSAWRRESELIENGILGFDTHVIFDESQNMKSHKGKLGKFMFVLSNVVQSLFLLTGTPWSNNQGDLFNQLRCLGWDIKYKEFEDRFLRVRAIPIKGKYTINVPFGNKNEKELKSIVYQYASLKTTEEVGIQLPEQNFVDIKLHYDNNIYDTVEANRFYVNKDEELLLLKAPLDTLTFLRQLANGGYQDELDISAHKKDALIDLLDSNKEDIVLFYNFNQELNMIKDVLKKNKVDIKIFECNGSNKDYVTRHEHKDKRQIILIQYLSGATGIELHDFKYVVFFSPTLSSQIYQQAIKRVHRIGQKENCFYYRFITKGTIEEKIYRTLKRGKDYTVMMFEKEMGLWE